jgi:YggT family protein
MFVISIAKILGLIITVFTFSILIQVIISWVNPGVYNPMTSLLYSINEPILGRARKIIPPIHGFDLSPIVAMIFLQLLSMLVVAPISDFGMTLR